MGIYTKEEQFELVKENPENLKLIDNQYEEVCIYAVRKHAYMLQYVKNQSEDVCIEAVKQIGEVIKTIENKTPEMCFYAFLNQYNLLDYKYIKDGVDKFIKNKYKINNIIFYNTCLYEASSYCYIDIDSLIFLKDFLLKENSGNKYILDDDTDIDILKEIALSNNELILVEDMNISKIHKILANRIVGFDEVQELYF